MVCRSFVRFTKLPRLALLAGLFGVSSPAAPAGPKVSFTPPLATAKTIQVTEIIWEAQNGPTPGPLRQAGTMTFCIERPDKFRVVFKEKGASKPTSYDISDGKTMVGYDGKRFYSQETARAEWPFPMMGLLNNMPGFVSCVPAVREGKKILLAVSQSHGDRSEFWFNPKTHLLIHWSMFIAWKGKTSEVMRTDYSGWVLNKPISPAVFHVPANGTQAR